MDDTSRNFDTGSTIARFVGSRHLPALLVCLGVLERIVWNLVRPGRGGGGEAMRVALAVGRGRGFADAYRFGQGATAHLLPVSPGIAGVLYRLLGLRSTSAEIVLAAWSIGLAMATYLVLFRTFERLGTPRWARLLGLGFACLAPTYIGQEAVDFRVWDGGLAALLAALFFAVLTAALFERSRGFLAAAVICALTFFVNPPLGVAVILCAAIFGLRELPLRQTALAAAVGAAVLAALIAPWAARNERVMHSPILLRSDAGLELAMANYPTALAATDRKKQFLDRLHTIHPSFNRDAFHAVRAEGELAYSRQVGARAASWMRAHPAEVAGLMLLHIRQTLLPQAWEFDVFGRHLSPALRAALADLASLAGLIGLALAVASGRRGFGYIATMIVAWVIVTSPFQPVPRYTYLIYPFLVFCGGEFLAQLRALVRPRRQLRGIRRGGFRGARRR